MQEAARRSRMALSVMLAVAAAVAAMVMMAVPVWAASKVFVSDVGPDGAATSVAANSDITATFSRAMKASSIKGSTFYLKREGSSTAIPAQVSYSGTNNTATLNPGSDLEAGATYAATIKGGKRGVKASDGGLLGGTTDPMATFANRKVTWGFTVAKDTVAPAAPSVHLDPGSNSGSQDDTITNDTTPTISGTAEASSTVKIYNVQNTVIASVSVGNDGSWSHTLSVPQDGTYSYTVKATDAADNESQGSSISLTIDTAAPETTLGDKPASLVNSASAGFTFSSSESGSAFECKLDQNAFASCTSPKSYSNLAEGPHSFQVRATDAAGNTDPTSASHTWTVDTIAPTVSNISPANTATGVDPSANVTATFSEAMNSSSITDQSFTLSKDGSPVAANVSYDNVSKKATLNPVSNLEVNTTYEAAITTSVKDNAGNAMAQSYTWSFTTALDSLPPTVSSVTPANGAIKVAINTKITATFSEEMDSSTVTNQSFTLYKSGSPVSAQVTYDPNSLTATLDPDQNLENGTTYDAKITTSAKDLAGNAITQQKSWSFTTADPGVTLTPDPLTFTSDALCFPESKYLTVNNNGPGDVTFASVSITGPDAARFSTGSQQFLANNGPFTVLAGNFFQDQVTFSPIGGPPQPRTYSATLTYKDGTGATIGSPVTLSARTSCLVFG